MSGRVTLLFHHDKADWISNLMAWATRADVTHVSMLDPGRGELVVEASGVGRPQGVRVVSLASWAAKHPNYTTRYIVDEDPEQIWNLCVGRAGDGYDWSYILGWWLRLKIEDPKKFVCQELIDWAFRMAGRPVFDTKQAHFLTPQHLYLISKPLE